MGVDSAMKQPGPSSDRRGSSAETRWAVLAGSAGVLLLAAAAWLRPMWYDEYFTHYVASLASPGAVAQALLAGADNGPPVDYWLRHASMSLLGPSTFALRVPSILGFLVCTWALAATVRGRTARVGVSGGGDSAAWIAVLVFGFTIAPRYAIEARAYSTLLACMAVSLWAWQRAVVHPDRRRYAVALWLALFLGPLSHYYGVLNYLPIFGAELAIWRRAPRCGRRWAALSLSLLSLGFLPAFATNAWQMKRYFWAAARNPWSVVDAYSSLLGVAALLLVLLGVLWFRNRPLAPAEFRKEYDAADHGVGVATMVLLLTPFVVYGIAATVTNAMAHRYALITTLGVALAGSWLVVPVALARPQATRALTAALTVALLAYLGLGLRGSESELDVPEWTAFVRGYGHALVVEDAQSFLRLYHDLPSSEGQKLLYLSDSALSVEHLGYDTDEIALPKLRPYAQFRLEGLEPYLRREPEISLVVGPEPRWLFTELEERNYEMIPVWSIGPRTVYRAKPPAHAR